MAVILDDATYKLVRNALSTGKKYGLTRCDKALDALNNSILNQLTERDAQLSETEAMRYIHEDEIRLLAFYRGEIAHGINGADMFAKLRDHILPGHYSPPLMWEVDQRRIAGERSFMLPEGKAGKPLLGSDEEN